MQFPQLPDYGVYLWWPQAGHGWIHPDDIAIATYVIPSTRVFRRERYDETYYHLRHAHHKLRVRPTMWLALRYEGIDCDDLVEVLSEGMEREAFIGKVHQMRYDKTHQQIHYVISRAGRTLPRRYLASELKALKTPQLKPLDGSWSHVVNPTTIDSAPIELSPETHAH